MFERLLEGWINAPDSMGCNMSASEEAEARREWLAEYDAAISDADLDALYGFIAGEGKFAHFGVGMRTYPGEADAHQRRAHAACVELWRRGRISRRDESEGVVFWQPAVQADPPPVLASLSRQGEGSPAQGD